MNNMPANNFLFDDEDSSVRVQEDDTCFLLCIEMPNVCEKDIQISLQRNVLTISGFRRSTTYSYSSEDDSDVERRASFNNTRTKRQRVSRQLEIDPNAIDIERAMSSTWNGCYTLYAPKRQPWLKRVAMPLFPLQRGPFIIMQSFQHFVEIPFTTHNSNQFNSGQLVHSTTPVYSFRKNPIAFQDFWPFEHTIFSNQYKQHPSLYHTITATTILTF